RRGLLYPTPDLRVPGLPGVGAGHQELAAGGSERYPGTLSLLLNQRRQNSPISSRLSLMRSPLRLPDLTWTERSLPEWTQCRMVCLARPSAFAAIFNPTQPGGASGTMRAMTWRERHPAPLPPLPSRAPRLATVYECPECSTRYLGDQRCPDCGVFCRRIGPGAECPHCD